MYNNKARNEVIEQLYPSLVDLIKIISDTYHQFPVVSDGKAILNIRFDESGNPVRKVVKRSNYRQSHQLFSQKTNKTMSCESVIEFNGSYILEMTPEVKSYCMQPAEITYVIRGEKHRHIPDALIELSSYKKCFLEFKARRELDDEELQARTDLMGRHLPMHGYGYLVICDEQVNGVALQNAKKLTHIQKTDISKETLLLVKRALETRQLVTIKALMEMLEQVPNIKNVLYQMLRQGLLRYDQEIVITDDTEINWKGYMS
jgi:hypothetical protein